MTLQITKIDPSGTDLADFFLEVNKPGEWFPDEDDLVNDLLLNKILQPNNGIYRLPFNFNDKRQVNALKKAWEQGKVQFGSNISTEQQQAFKNFIQRSDTRRILKNIAIAVGLSLPVAVFIMTAPYWLPAVTFIMAATIAAAVVAVPLMTLIGTGTYWLANRNKFNLFKLFEALKSSNQSSNNSSPTVQESTYTATTNQLASSSPPINSTNTNNTNKEELKKIRQSRNIATEAQQQFKERKNKMGTLIKGKLQELLKASNQIGDETKSSSQKEESEQQPGNSAVLQKISRQASAEPKPEGKHINVIQELLKTEQIYRDNIKEFNKLLVSVANNIAAEKISCNKKEREKYDEMVNALAEIAHNPFETVIANNEISSINVDNFEIIIRKVHKLMGEEFSSHATNEVLLVTSYSEAQAFFIKYKKQLELVLEKGDYNNIMSYLIQPVQRSPRRELLAAELIKQYNKYEGSKNNEIIAMLNDIGIITNCFAKITNSIKAIADNGNKNTVSTLSDPNFLEGIISSALGSHLENRKSAHHSQAVSKETPTYVMEFQALIKVQIKACEDCTRFNNLINPNNKKNKVLQKMGARLESIGLEEIIPDSVRKIQEVSELQQAIINCSLKVVFSDPQKITNINAYNFATQLEEVITIIDKQAAQIAAAISCFHTDKEMQNIISDLGAAKYQGNPNDSVFITNGLVIAESMAVTMLTHAKNMQRFFENHLDSQKPNSKKIADSMEKIIKTLEGCLKLEAVSQQEIASSSTSMHPKLN